MANNVNMYKFEVIEGIIKAIDFKTKEEVVELARKMMESAQSNPKYSAAVKKAFKEAYEELSADDLTLENLFEIKNMLD
ncbi:MAG: hypothetical protein IJE91_00425 [Clostridia bacterium]|nr:hypothetical protein [Clostridia bacterium]